MSDTFQTRLTLLERAKSQSDEGAWEELLLQYRRYLYGIVKSMGITGTDADDVVQQVNLKLWKNLPSYQYNPEGAKFRSWVGRIAHNEVLNYCRSRKNYANRIERFEQSTTDGDTTPEIDRIITREWETFITDQAFDNVAKHFSEKAVEAFRLQLSGMSVNDVSAKLDVKADSVYKYCSRIKVRLIEEVRRLREDYEF